MDLRNEKINYKVREHSLAKIPYIIVCGKKEVADNTVTVRKLGSDKQEIMKRQDLIKIMLDLNKLPLNKCQTQNQIIFKGTKPQGPRANERIRALDVQVIGSDGANLGTMPLKKAVDLAKQEDLDSIEISPNANPPVCKIMDMGKYKYDLQKKLIKQKKKTKNLYH